MEIKSAEEIFSNNWCGDDSGSSIEEIAVLSMKQYAEQFIDIATEEARIKFIDIEYNKEETLFEYRGTEGYDDNPILVNIDKESILKVKQLIK